MSHKEIQTRKVQIGLLMAFKKVKLLKAQRNDFKRNKFYKVLILAAHYDDDIIGCGGTIAFHCINGDSCDVIFMTDSSGLHNSDYNKKRLSIIRKQESYNALRQIGFINIICWEQPDGYLTPNDPIPKFLGITGIDIKNNIEDNNWIPFSLTYYMVFIARYRYLFNKNPDQRYWIWLPKGRYDRSGMLIAGFDNNDQFNVHGWMPHFSASFLGARYLEASIASK